jgi:protocadherin Fat 1/2/3
MIAALFDARSSYKEVHVRLADLNDHPPVFDKEEYEIRVPESAPINTPLTRLKVPVQTYLPSLAL